MSRPIKFRVWDKKRNKMYYPGGNLFVWNNDCNYPEIGQDLEVKDSGCWSNEGIIDDEPVIQQFTGLLDKNRNEVYEGDIYLCEYELFPYGKIKHNFTITYNPQTGGFLFPTNDILGQGFCPFPYYCKRIGNIFENPELLK